MCQQDEKGSPLYASIGGLIIDDIKYQDGRLVTNILGGGGVFAVMGMRLWQPEPLSKNIGYIIHQGMDYPQEIDDQIKRLNISEVSIHHADMHTTRGLNTFGADDHRDFEYIHPIIRTTTSHFPDSWIKSVKILHLISSPERAIEIIDEWKEREVELESQEKTQFLWEPLPWACLPECLDTIYTASKRTEIVTPNHEELAEMLGFNFKFILEQQHHNDFKRTVEYCGNKFIDGISGETNIKTLVVRASKYGTMMMEINSRIIHWIPAYWCWWGTEDSKNVVDVTGAGNAFCGGFAYAWIKTNGDALESAYYGAVSASFTVEQIGVPKLQANEQWNKGPSPLERLDILKNNKSCKFV